MTEDHDHLIDLATDIDLDEEVARLRELEAYCAPNRDLLAEAMSGWNPKWHSDRHPSNCQRCKSAALASLRNGNPGFWILRESSQPDRPRWWRTAVDEFMRKAPLSIRMLEALARSVNDLATIIPTSTAALSTRAQGQDESEDLWICEAIDFANPHLRSELFYSQSRSVYRLVVTDTDLSSPREGASVRVDILDSRLCSYRIVLIRQSDGSLTGAVPVEKAAVVSGRARLFPPVLDRDPDYVIEQSGAVDQ